MRSMYLYLLLSMVGCGYDPSCITGCRKPAKESQVVAETEVPGCSAFRVDGGVQVSCPDGSAILRDGTDGLRGEQGLPGVAGVDGLDGVDAVLPGGTIVGFIDPCGEEALDEILFVAADGTLFGHYADGERQHLVRLIPGVYLTTDGFSCEFRVTEENQVVPNIEPGEEG